MNRLLTLICILCCTLATAVHAQQAPGMSLNAHTQIRKGNMLYAQKNYAAAENAFAKALAAQQQNPTACFNYGDALMQQKKYDSARHSFQQVLTLSSDKMLHAKAQHNMGNAYAAERKWKEAIEAYKAALRNNPADADTKYNLAYAQKMLQQQQNKDKNKDKDKKDKEQDKDKNKGNQQPEDQNKKNQQQQNKDKDNQGDKEQESPQDQQQQKPQQGEAEQKGPMDQRQADAILKALQQNEQKIQSGKNKKGIAPVKLDKDW